MSKYDKEFNSRRRFIKRGLALTGAAAFPFFFSRSARADGIWGDFKSNVLSSGPFKVLEIHCYGAPSIWETLWVTKKANGDPDYRNFDDEMAAAEFLCTTPGRSGPPGSSDLSALFGTDDSDNEIFLGPAAQPAWHLADRMRLVVQRHDNPMIPIHEAAVPYAVTGTRVGDPRHAGAGAAIAHRQIALGSTQLAPHAYVIGTGSPLGISFLHNSATAVGRHPGQAKPLLLRLGSAADLTSRLARVNASPQRDRLLQVLAGQYREELLYHADAARLVRSEDYASYQASIDAAFNAPNLTSILSNDLLTVGSVDYCVKETGASDPPVVLNRIATGMELARALLTRTTDAASYVMVCDTGIETISGSQPCYDTHGSLVASSFEMVRATTANLYNMFSALAAVIDPTGNDPDKINLNDTLVVINMEFGRTVEPCNGIGNCATDSSGNPRKGREHWEDGYVGVLLGGPITASTGRIAGALNAAGQPPGAAWFSPTDFRSAVLLAAGIWPFEPEIYGTSNSGPNINAGTEQGNAQNVVSKILGAS